MITDTARVHWAAWKRLFDTYLAQRDGEDLPPFTDDDYRRYLDGKLRADGIVSFLKSRGISLPRRGQGDSPWRGTAKPCMTDVRFVSLAGPGRRAMMSRPDD